MSRVALLLAVCLLPTAGLAQAPRLYVDVNVPTPGDGSSWTQAFDTVGKALLTARPDTTIWVAAGTYTAVLVIPARITLLGGFMSGATRPTQRDPAKNRTILDSYYNNRVVNVGQDSVLDGFIFQHGWGWFPYGGGGALLLGTRATIRNSIFTLNRNPRGSPGSAIAVTNGGQLILENSILYKNGGSAGAIEIDRSSSALLNHVVVFDNDGDGLRCTGSTFEIHNSIFAKNTGRGISDVGSSGSLVLDNNLLWDNAIAHYNDRGRDLRTIAEVNLLAHANNNFTGDPRFADPAQLDFRLTASSPAIDKGRIVALAPATDLYSNSRLVDGNLDGRLLPDPGASEYANIRLAITGNTKPGGTMTVALTGRTGLASVLAIGALPGQTLVDPFGYLLICPAGFLVLPCGVLPAIHTFSIPRSFPSGIALIFQGLALTSTAGNLSNAIDQLIR